MFRDRRNAGELLALALEKYKHAHNTIVIGLPRGGVVLADVIAEKLKLPLDVICPRKISLPSYPEFAIGAVDESGTLSLNDEAVQFLHVSDEDIRQIAHREMLEAQKRLTMFRKNCPQRDLKDKTVIIVDDGLATGYTMKAAVLTAKDEGAKKVIVAIPVSSINAAHMIEKICDEFICLMLPENFMAVGQFYLHFDQTHDQEVMQILSKY